MASLEAKSPTYDQAEIRYRGDFIRTIMRRNEGVNEEDLREIIATKIAPRLRARLLKEAVERITQHRAAGHRTVLITGQIDVFVEPLSGLFDDIVAGKMERSEEHTSELQSRGHLVCRLLLEKKKHKK